MHHGTQGNQGVVAIERPFANVIALQQRRGVATHGAH
jgi:hypothetical protein